MYRALYPFQKTHPTSLTFGHGDVFVELPGARPDKNWHFVLDKKGNKGFVPRNYVGKVDKMPSKDEFLSLLENIKGEVVAQRIAEKERADTLAKIEFLKNNFSCQPANPDDKEQQHNSVNLSVSDNAAKPKNSLSVTNSAASSGAEAVSMLPKAPSPRPDSLSSNDGNILKHGNW